MIYLWEKEENLIEKLSIEIKMKFSSIQSITTIIASTPYPEVAIPIHIDVMIIHKYIGFDSISATRIHVRQSVSELIDDNK